MIISFAGDLNFLISYTGFTQWSQRICTIAVLLMIRFRKIPTDADAIRFPILFPISFFIICFAFVSLTQRAFLNVDFVCRYCQPTNPPPPPLHTTAYPPPDFENFGEPQDFIENFA